MDRDLFTQELKRQLQAAPDYGLATREWAAVLRSRSAFPDLAGDLFAWVFGQYQGYTETRAKAGHELFKLDASRAWGIVEQLAASADPNDRDAALEFLSDFHEARAYELARPMLRDPDLGLRWDAIDYLKSVYPTEVEIVLHELVEHSDPRVRATAHEKLNAFARPQT